MRRGARFRSRSAVQSSGPGRTGQRGRTRRRQPAHRPDEQNHSRERTVAGSHRHLATAFLGAGDRRGLNRSGTRTVSPRFLARRGRPANGDLRNIDSAAATAPPRAADARPAQSDIRTANDRYHRPQPRPPGFQLPTAGHQGRGPAFCRSRAGPADRNLPYRGRAARPSWRSRSPGRGAGICRARRGAAGVLRGRTDRGVRSWQGLSGRPVDRPRRGPGPAGGIPGHGRGGHSPARFRDGAPLRCVRLPHPRRYTGLPRGQPRR